MKKARAFQAELEPLESRQLLSGVRLHAVAIVGNGTAFQTSITPQASGGGVQVVQLITGRATDLGPYSGALTYTLGSGGGPVSGSGVIHSIHKYELDFTLTGNVVPAVAPATGMNTDLILKVTGGTKRFLFSSGQGQITGASSLGANKIHFTILGQLTQVK